MADDAVIGLKFVADSGNVKQVAEDVKRDLDLKNVKAPPIKLDVTPTLDVRSFATLKSALFQPTKLEVLPTVTAREIKLPPVTFDISQSLNATNNLIRKLSENLKKDLENAANEGLGSIKKNLEGALSQPKMSGQITSYRNTLSELAQWKKLNGDILSQNREMQAAYKSLTESAEAGLRKVADRSRNLADLGGVITAGLAGVGTVFGGIATGSLLVAANFEQLRAKLISVTGSLAEANAKFEFAQKFAAQSPFDVEGVVASTAVLTGFGQKAEEVLPAAANLAAAMGTSLAEATQTIGKAAGGSLEGFESLRSTYAITTADLKKFGLEVDKQGQILSRTPSQIERNRAALLKLIAVRYGDATARQSQTFQGAMSNLGDATQSALAQFGESLIPVGTLLARLGADVVNFVAGIPAGFKTVIAAGVALTGGLAIAGAGVAGFTTALFLLQSQLLSTAANMAGTFPAAAAATTTAAGVAGAGINLLTGAVARLSAATTFLLTTPLGIFITAAAAAAALGTLAINSYAKAQENAGRATSEASRKLSQATVAFRDIRNTLNAAGKETGVFIGFSGNLNTQLNNVNNAFRKLSAQTVVESFQRAGETTESLKDKLNALENGAGQVQEKLKALMDAQTALENQTAGLDFPADELKAFGIELDYSKDLLPQVAEQIAAVKQENLSLARSRIALTSVIEAFEQFAEPLERVVKESQKLSGLLDLGKQIGTAQSLAISLAEVEAQIKKNSAVAGIGTDNLDKLFAKLQDRSISDSQKQAVEEQIKLVQQKKSIEEAEKKRQDDLLSKQLEQQDLAFRRRKALGEAGLQDELKKVSAQLGIVRQGTEDEIALLERKAAIKKELSEKELNDARNALQQLSDLNTRGVDTARDGGDQAGVVRAIDAAIEATRAWRDANGQLIQTYPELSRQLEQLERKQGLERQRELAKLAKDNVQELSAAFSNLLADASNNSAKLTVIEQALGTFAKARRTGLLDEAAAQSAVNVLTRQKLQLENQITQEKNNQLNEIRSQEQANKDQEIQILEARKTAGESVDKELEAAYQARLQMALQAIDIELQAQIQAGRDSELAAQQAALRRANVMEAETLRIFQEQEKRDGALKSSLDRQAGLYKQQENRIGGSKSPIYSDPAAGGFSFGESFSLSTPTPAVKRKAPDIGKIRREVEARGGVFGTSEIKQENVKNTSSQSVTNNSVTFNGAPLNGAEFENAVLTIVKKANQQAQFKRGA